MSKSRLPERASLEYLKKLAKERLHELRVDDPAAKVAAAQLAVARDHGFASWGALKAEIDARREPISARWFTKCRAGDVQVRREMLADGTATGSSGRGDGTATGSSGSGDSTATRSSGRGDGTATDSSGRGDGR